MWVAGRSGLRQALSSRLESDRGPKDLSGRGHADVVRHHALGVCAECERGAGIFAIAYGSLAFTAASIWSLPGDVAPTPAHVASIGGIQNFASNLAGIVTTTFTGVMLTITSGSYVVPLVVAGVFCVVGAAVYLFVVGEIAPLPPLSRDSPVGEAGAMR